MLFDQLCGIVERWFPKVEKTMRDAKLFWWPGKPEDLPQTMTAEEAVFLKENFFLPFKTIAIEDSVSCMVIQDMEDEQRGTISDRRFIECMGINDEVVLDSREARLAPEETPKMLAHLRRLREEYGQIYTIAFGRGSIPIVREESCKLSGGLEGMFFINDRDKTIRALTPADPQAKEQTESSMRNFMTAMEEVAFLNSPSRFVVETRRTNARSPDRTVKIPRSHDRPLYTLLTKSEVQGLLQIPYSDVEDRKHPSAHWRRRHYRTFHSDHFVTMKGKTVVIPACWVGPTEKVVGGKRYRVRLDL